MKCAECKYCNYEGTGLAGGYKCRHPKIEECAKKYEKKTNKRMTKADLIDYNHVLLNNWEATDELYKNVMEYARKLQKELDNPPLKFEELEEGMWVWDNLWYEKNYVLIKKIFFEGTNRCVAMLQDEEGMARLFEENRFYRMEV
ncbi:hypothetical protein DW969_15905 [Eubacterium sp. AM47-9]|nr:hypothetical protein DW969_15905 [Eubacterium sp. AM47-9]